MRVIVMGCGRVGSTVARRVAAAGHAVTVLDTDRYSFRRLAPGFPGQSLVGDGTRHRSLEEAGIRDADAFLALTQGDNRNILASQIAKHLYSIPTVVTRVYDPYRAEIFGQLGLNTFSPTNVGADMAWAALFGSEDPAGAAAARA